MCACVCVCTRTHCTIFLIAQLHVFKLFEGKFIACLLLVFFVHGHGNTRTHTSTGIYTNLYLFHLFFVWQTGKTRLTFIRELIRLHERILPLGNELKECENEKREPGHRGIEINEFNENSKSIHIEELKGLQDL